VARRDIEKFQEVSAGHHSSTYIGAGGVALESAGVDLHNGATPSIINRNSSALEVAVNWSKHLRHFVFKIKARIKRKSSANKN
jgi:hypothetical protein